MIYENIIRSDSFEDTMKVGATMGSCLTGDNLILLSGDLAAGKTVFTKGLAIGLDIPDMVKSPTYTVMCEYYGRLTLHHIDAYNITSAEEFYNLGFDELLDENSVMVIEWPEVFKGALPKDYIEVNIYKDKFLDNVRNLEIKVCGEKSKNVLQEWELKYGRK